MPNLLYLEKQKTYLILIAAFILIALVILALTFFPGVFGAAEPSDAVKLVLLILALADLLMLWSFSSLTIKASEKYLIFGFGVFKKRFFWHQIKEAKVENFHLTNYLGYGIRFGRDGSIAWAARGGLGVRLKTNKRYYFFSTDHPEQLAALISSKLFV